MNKVVTTLVAAVGGFVAGILLAPKSGKETRQDLMNKTDEYKRKAKNGVEEAKRGGRLVKDEIIEGTENLKNIAQDAGKSANSVAARVKNEVTERAQAIKKDVGATTQNVKKTTRK